jgi:predicted dehydrogenase
VIGERGTIWWDYFSNKVTCYSPDKRDPWAFEYAASQRNDRFLEEMRHLLACLEGREQPKVDALAASRTLKLALAAKQAAATGSVCRLEES